MFAAAAVEFIVAGFAFKRPDVRALLSIFWLSLVFTVYRLGLLWMGWKKPCNCLGDFTDALNISAQTADNVMKFVLVFILVGSSTFLALHSRRKTLKSAGLT
jgi:hypothetical protein